MRLLKSLKEKSAHTPTHPYTIHPLIHTHRENERKRNIPDIFIVADFDLGRVPPSRTSSLKSPPTAYGRSGTCGYVGSNISRFPNQLFCFIFASFFPYISPLVNSFFCFLYDLSLIFFLLPCPAHPTLTRRVSIPDSRFFLSSVDVISLNNFNVSLFFPPAPIFFFWPGFFLQFSYLLFGKRFLYPWPVFWFRFILVVLVFRFYFLASDFLFPKCMRYKKEEEKKYYKDILFIHDFCFPFQSSILRWLGVQKVLGARKNKINILNRECLL